MSIRYTPKRGDRVRHIQGGWLATVTEERLNTVMVISDSTGKSGEYSSIVFEEVADSTQPVVETPTTEEQHEEPS